MKKIKSMQALKDERNRIAKAQIDLLDKIKQSWLALKANVPFNNTSNSNALNMNQSNTGMYDESILKKSLTYTLILLAEKMAGKLSEKISHIKHK